MSRAVGSKDYISLTKGLITEASPLSFPEGATTDELNFILNLDGMARVRRKGFEDTAALHSESTKSGASTSVSAAMYWESPNVYLVAYVVNENKLLGGKSRQMLRVHKNSAAFEILGEYKLSDVAAEISMSQSTDYVVITCGETVQPYVIEHLSDTDEVRLSALDLYIRDFELVEDTYALNTRPSDAVLNDSHRYNLLNAGWYAFRTLASTGLDGSPITDFYNSESEYPSNSDVAYLGVKFNATEDREEFSSKVLKETVVGSTETPRGHYIYDIGAFDRDLRVSFSDFSGAPGSTITNLETWSL